MLPGVWYLPAFCAVKLLIYKILILCDVYCWIEIPGQTWNISSKVCSYLFHFNLGNFEQPFIRVGSSLCEHERPRGSVKISHSNFGIQGWRTHVMTKRCSEFRNTEWMHTSLLTMSSPLQIENWKTDVSEMIIEVSRPRSVDKSISKLFALTLQALGVHIPGWKSDLQKLWEKVRPHYSCLMIFLSHS